MSEDQQFLNPLQEPVKFLKLFIPIVIGLFILLYVLDDYTIQRDRIHMMIMKVVGLLAFVYIAKNNDERLKSFMNQYGIFVSIGVGVVVIALWLLSQSMK